MSSALKISTSSWGFGGWWMVVGTWARGGYGSVDLTPSTPPIGALRACAWHIIARPSFRFVDEGKNPELALRDAFETLARFSKSQQDVLVAFKNFKEFVTASTGDDAMAQ